MTQQKLPRVARMATLAIAVSFLASVAANANVKPKVEFVKGEFVVELQPTAETQNFSSLSLMSLSARLGVTVVDRIRDDLVLVQSTSEKLAVGVDAEERVETVLERLRANPQFALVEPNFIYRTSKIPNDPDFEETWGLKNSGLKDSSGVIGISDVDIGAEGAWDFTTGSKSVVIAVIDTGIDFSHPDLAPQAWVNAKEFAGKPGVDDDGNGYVDDVNGYDFANNRGKVTDDNQHGTHCAGTIGAKGNDGRGIAGVAWDVSLMGIKFIDKNGSGTLANAIKAIEYARKNGARILSNSWSGGASSELLRKAIEDTEKSGMLFVAAAGNTSNDNDVTGNFPASYPVSNVIAVSAIDNRGRLATFSNWGQKSVHIAAPGVNIVSTIPGGGYASFSGTSMATPHVAGAAGLMLAQNPNLTAAELKKRILNSARPLYGLKKRVITGGMLSAYHALSGVTPTADPNDPSRLKNVTSYSLSTDHNYEDGASLEHRIHIPGAKKIAVRFSQFSTEVGFDTVSFFDRDGLFVGALSGAQDIGVFSPLVFGDTVVIKFVSDESNNDYGFDVDAVLYE